MRPCSRWVGVSESSAKKRQASLPFPSRKATVRFFRSWSCAWQVTFESAAQNKSTERKKQSHDGRRLPAAGAFRVFIPYGATGKTKSQAAKQRF